MRYIAWSIVTLAVIIPLKMCRNEANNRTFTLFSEEASIFSKDIFPTWLSFLFGGLTKNSQNVCKRRILISEKQNIVTHICNIIITHQIYKMIFLDLAITFINENSQSNSKEYTLLGCFSNLPTKDHIDANTTSSLSLCF